MTTFVLPFRNSAWELALRQGESQSRVDAPGVACDNVQSRTSVLGYAARQGRVWMIQFLLEQGTDKNPNVSE